ncbi:MAG: hypothetical protein ACO1TE_08495 [Prosthecobacter sp.]
MKAASSVSPKAAVSSENPPPAQLSPGDPPVKEAEMLKKERIEIQAQRDLRKQEAAAEAPHVGLSLSGGGIRSATFCLGVLQMLSRLPLHVTGAASRPLIEFVDYLSTVSGGGYIGSWFVANRKREMNTNKAAGTSFAIEVSSGKGEDVLEKSTQPVAHLRRYSHYLAPESGLMSGDTWTMVVIWLRNTVLIQAMVFLAIACCFMLPHLWLRLVNGIPWLLNEAGPCLQHVKESGMLRLLELMFPASAFALLYSAFKKTKVEIALYAEDREAGENKEKAETITPIDQSKVQKRIVLPVVASALVMTLWLCLHHNLLHLQQAPTASDGFWPMPWFRGMEPSNMLFSPLMLLFIVSVLFLAHRLMWLPETLEDKKIAATAKQETQPPERQDAAKPGPKWPRRVLYYLALLAGSLFSFYVVDGAFCVMHDQTVALAKNAQSALEINVSTGHGELHADYSPKTPPAGSKIGMGLAATAGPALMVLKYLFMLILALGMAGRRMHDNVREWWSRVGAWLMIYSLAVLAVCGISLFGPVLFDWVGARWSGWMQGGVISAWLATLWGTLVAGKSEKNNGEGRKTPFLNLGTAAVIVLVGMLCVVAWFVRYMLTPDGYAPQVTDPLLLDALSQPREWLRYICVFVVFALAALALVWRVDLNEFSMNHFYRNRLVRCYLGGATWAKDDRRPHPFTGFEFRDDQALASFVSKHRTEKEEEPSRYPGPYPLINTAINTSQGGDLDVQERKSESFLLSPLYCGSSRRRLSVSTKELAGVCEGYRPTRQFMSGVEPPKRGTTALLESNAELESDADTHGEGIKLGTAVSISGAAASPNSGYHTAPVMAFLMTLFNVRLGWWAPNPAKTQWWKQAPDFGYPKKSVSAGKAPPKRQAPGLGFLQYLAYELFGSATPNSEFVYLSDGGHFENLGIYELVRRQCVFIIAVDGEEDGAFTFHALGTAIRRCRVDFDAEIKICVDEMRPDPATGLSRSHCAVGKIYYPGIKKPGTLLYIKSCLTGDEATDIAQYKKMSPAFPHESTGDQFFSESQFESYRQLGQHAALEAFAPLRRPAMKAGETNDPTGPLRADLEQHWYRAAKAPNESFINHTERLDEIWASLAEDDLPDCISDIVLPRKSTSAQEILPTNADEAHKVICFGQRLIQLMENVCLDLQLSAQSTHPDHTGWVELFKGWAGHEVLDQIWKDSKGTYGTRFANFWEDLRREYAEDRAKGELAEKEAQEKLAQSKKPGAGAVT